jgi:hypothetical protein
MSEAPMGRRRRTEGCAARLSIVMGQNPMIRPATSARPASRPATLAHLCTRASAPVNENLTATLRAVTAPPGAALPRTGGAGPLTVVDGTSGARGAGAARSHSE